MRLIDADALKNKMLSHAPIIVGDFYKIINFIDEAPTVERPYGEWILDAVSPCSISWFRCSYCGYKYEAYKHSNYCPNCGASMSKLQANGEQVKNVQWCKFKSEKNCNFCSFHSDCEICWKEGGEK